MPGYWNGSNYYEGDRQGDDPEVPTPPGPDYEWNGSEWVYTLEACHALRLAAYPTIGDQLDALWKMLTPPVGSEAEVIKEKIRLVKEQYPKPVV